MLCDGGIWFRALGSAISKISTISERYCVPKNIETSFNNSLDFYGRPKTIIEAGP